LSPRSRATFAKRQKEQARQEKQRAKAQRKLQRKLDNQSPVGRAEFEGASPAPEPQLPFERWPEGSHSNPIKRNN
jgi:hypothetical protein